MLVMHRRGRPWLMWVSVGLGICACSHDWDDYDPRLGTGGVAGSVTAGAGGGVPDASSGGNGGTGGAGGTSGTGPSGGTGATGATGGTGGSGGTGATGGMAGTTGSGGIGATGGTAGTTGSGGTGATGGTGGIVDAGPSSLKVTATVADCIATSGQTPNPDYCFQKTGSMSVDGECDDMIVGDASVGPPAAAFMRFEISNTLAGKIVTQVTLQVTVNNDANADGQASGEVWTVSSFTRPSLFTTVPTKVSKVGNSQGPVVQNQTVSWLLPSSLVTAGQPVFLGIFPTTTNGVDYYNALGLKPPTLIVDYQ